MESVALEVLRRRSIRGGDSFEIFGDGGTGVIDATSPLTDRPLAYWEGLPPSRGHLANGHLAGLHLDHVLPDGHLACPHLLAEHLWPGEVLTFTTRPLYFGRFQFAAATVDSTGNRSDELSTPVERVVNSSPRQASSLARGSFDPVTRRMTFSFTPSPDL